MSEYVAFLRGINVGGRIIKMIALQKCFEELGCERVLTLLQSGNVLFESRVAKGKLQALIEGGLTKTFKYPAKVIVLSKAELGAVVDAYPFPKPSSEEHDYVVFMKDGLEKALAKAGAELEPAGRIKLGNGVVYWRVARGNTLDSAFAKLLVKAAFKEHNTNRNLKTLRRILDKK